MNEVATTGDTDTHCPSTETTRQSRRQARWESISVSVAALLVVAAGVLGLWISSTDSINENYRQYLMGLAKTAATLVDPALHKTIRRPEQRNGPDYMRAVEPLRRMRLAVADIHYIYTMVADGAKVRFVLDAADPQLNPEGIEDQAAVWEVYDERDPAMLQALGNDRQPGVAAATDRPYQDKWGVFMTGWAPILDASGRQIGVIGVDVDASVFIARLAAARHWALLGLVPATILVCVVGAAFYRIRSRGLADAQQASEAAQVLAEERQRLKAVIQSTQVGTWEWDFSDNTVIVDDPGAAMLGDRLSEMSGLTLQAWQLRVHPEDVPALGEAVAACLNNPDHLLVHEFRMKHAKGHWLWILARGKLMPTDARSRSVRMAGINMDVSARKMAEVALRESELKFRSLFELSPVGIALNDLHTGQFLQFNDALVAPTGYSREELLKMTYWDLTPEVYAPEETSHLQALERTSRYGPYEKEYLRKDGSRYSVLLSGIRLQDANGRAVIWSIVQDISHRKALESELANAAHRDKLTGLANRRLFMECLQEAMMRVRRGEQGLYAVLFLDFDRFKLVNDTLGHEAGDELLRQIAGRLQNALRVSDTLGGSGNLVGRFGGDEFLILLNNLQSATDSSRVAERLLTALTPAYSISGREVLSTASIGIVTSEQTHASAEEVVRNADVAMYEAKRSGRARSVLFNESMHTRLTRHVNIESGLRRAIGREELYLVYQPIVDLHSGRMVSAEALLRWDHPTLGRISPSEFIPIAEESGLILAVGQWVLKEACQAMAKWRRFDPARAPETISVNISRAELALGDRLMEQVRSSLDGAGLPARCIQLEVTEREVMRNSESCLELLHDLRDLGIKLAMDDFGTGTSSLAFLREYPFDTIKIDRSFVDDLTTNPDVMAVIHATINLIENLGMASLAEGIEHPEQVAVLQSLGCRYAQGYLFSQPVCADRLLDALESSNNDLPRSVGSLS